MKAAILENGSMHVGDFPDPTPETGQVVVRTHRCALCASDAHFLKSGHTIVERSQANNGPYAGVDLSKPIVMGCGAIGLSVITGLQLSGVSPIVACDLSANRRVVDPSKL